MSTAARLEPERVKVLDIELSRPLEDLHGLAGYGQVQGLVRAHGVPIGFVHVATDAGACTAKALREAVLQQLNDELLAHLREVGTAATPVALREAPFHELFVTAPSAREGPLPALTVAVCTRDRTLDLARCLDALVQLDYPDLELLVIDNAPSDEATARLLEDRYPAVRYVREPRPGLDWARNRAVLEARGDLIAFTDDDVVVEPDWARAIAAGFAAGDDVMAVVGLVVPFELETAAQLQFERYGGFMAWFTQKKLRGEADWGVRGAWHYAQMAQYFSGASMAFRRRTFETLGLFDPALGAGTPTNAGDDTDMFFRVLKEGFAIVYEPRAIARHSHRREYAQLRRQILGWGSGYYAFLTRNAFAYPEAAWVLALFGMRGLWQQAMRLVGALFRPPGFPRSLLWTELRGALTGPFRYWRARRRAAAIARAFGPAVRPLPTRADVLA